MREINLPINPAIACEVLAKNDETAGAIAEIANVCARDVGQPLVVKARVDDAAGKEALTLHLPAALAVAQHPIWCLACRLACFCPNARVSILVRAETSFGPKQTARRRRTSAAVRDRSAA